MRKISVLFCLSLCFVVCVIPYTVSAQAALTGIATVGGTDSTTTTGAGGSSKPTTGDLVLTFSSANETYSVEVGYDGTSTASSLATSLCAALTTYVRCTGTAVDPSGYYNLSLTSSLSFLATASVTYTGGGDSGGRGGGSVQRVGAGFKLSAPNWGQVQPLYYVEAMLYAAPGNASSVAFTNSTSSTLTSSVGSNFTSGVSQSYSVSFGFGGDKISAGTTSGSSTSTTSSESFQQSVQTTSGSTLKSTEAAIDHTQDQFWLLLNPEVTMEQTSSGVTYSVSTVNNASADVVNVSADELMNPTLIPLAILETQTDPITGLPLPGLKNVCAKPLPDNQCTQANSCGCSAADFSQILPLDELLTVQLSSNPNQDPVSYDPSRFTYVTNIVEEGPACSPGCGTVTNNYSITDSDIASTTNGGSQTYSVGYNLSWSESFLGIVSASGTSSKNFSWTNNYSFGAGTGTAHSESVIMGTNNVGCYLTYYVYEDGEFHTFAFYPSSPNLPPC